MILLKKNKKKIKIKKYYLLVRFVIMIFGHLDPLPFIPCKLDFELRLFYFFKKYWT